MTLEARDHKEELFEAVFKIGKISKMVKTQDSDKGPASGLAAEHPPPMNAEQLAFENIALRDRVRHLEEEVERVKSAGPSAAALMQLDSRVQNPAEQLANNISNSNKQNQSQVAPNQFQRILI